MEDSAGEAFEAPCQQRLSSLGDFSKLPLELRLQIWHLVMPDCRIPLKPSKDFSHSLAILRASSALCEEISTELYRHYTYDLTVGPYGIYCVEPEYRSKTWPAGSLPIMNLSRFATIEIAIWAMVELLRGETYRPILYDISSSRARTCHVMFLCLVDKVKTLVNVFTRPSKRPFPKDDHPFQMGGHD